MYPSIYTAVLGLVHPSFELAFPTVPIAFENGPFDRNNLPDLWVEFEVKFYSASQIGCAAYPKTRTRGFVYVTVYSKEGTGTLASLGVMNWFAVALAYKTAPRLTLMEPELIDQEPMRGWAIESLKVAFHHDEP